MSAEKKGKGRDEESALKRTEPNNFDGDDENENEGRKNDVPGSAAGSRRESNCCSFSPMAATEKEKEPKKRSQRSDDPLDDKERASSPGPASSPCPPGTFSFASRYLAARFQVLLPREKTFLLTRALAEAGMGMATTVASGKRERKRRELKSISGRSEGERVVLDG